MNKVHRTRAFTLIELLLAAAIAITLVTLLVAVAQSVLHSYQQTTQDTAAERDANFALDVIIPDLEALVIPPSRGGEALRSTIETVENRQMNWLTFLTSSTDRDPSNHVGFPRAVSYRAAYQDPVSSGGPNQTFALYRAVSDAKETFNDALTASNLQANYWDSRPTTELGDYLVGNVLEFKVSFLPVGGSDWQTLRNPSDILSITSAGASTQNSSGPPALPKGVGAMEVMITVLTAKGADMLKRNVITPERAQAEFSRSFTRRAPLLSRPH